MTPFLLLFGLAIFLFAMHHLEAGIRQASGQGLKNWIVNRTSNAYSSAGYGVIVTAILQSSSMVSLLVLAFVSAGIIPLYNGIGVVLGANLGTTMTGWVATIIGFKMNLQALVVPLLGCGAGLSLAAGRRRRWRGLGQALFAFGLLIFGLDIMKDSVSGLSEIYDVSALQDMPAWVFLISGMLLAAIMQSSSAVMIITLSLISANVIQLTDAAALVIGADLGTTSTTVLGSLGQSVIKKQLALAHVVFNVVVDLTAFIVLLPFLPQLLNLLGVQDAMFGLVTFHSLFNLLGVLVFLPILRQYTRWIEKRLPASDGVRESLFNVPVEVPEAAIDTLRAALEHLSRDAVDAHLAEFRLAVDEFDPSLDLADVSGGNYERQYEELKSFEGDIVRYASRLTQTSLSEAQSTEVNNMLESARSMVYASKTLKDIRLDLELLYQGEEHSMEEKLQQLHQHFLSRFMNGYLPLLLILHQREYVSEQVNELAELNGEHHEQANALVTKYLADNHKLTTPVSTWFNLSHELHHYTRYMLSSLSKRYRDPAQQR